jgi:hypothetical protein
MQKTCVYSRILVVEDIFPQRRYVCNNLECTVSEAIIPGIFDTYEDNKS